MYGPIAKDYSRYQNGQTYAEIAAGAAAEEAADKLEVGDNVRIKATGEDGPITSIDGNVIRVLRNGRAGTSDPFTRAELERV